jgi:hypothetical protein
MLESKKERERVVIIEGKRRQNVLEEAGPGSSGSVAPLGTAGYGGSAQRTGALSVEPLQHTVLTENVSAFEHDRLFEGLLAYRTRVTALHHLVFSGCGPVCRVLNEVNDGSVKLSGPGKSDSSLYHEVGGRDDDGKDGPRVVGVGEIAEPQWQREEVTVELRYELQYHVVLSFLSTGQYDEETTSHQGFQCHGPKPDDVI